MSDIVPLRSRGTWQGIINVVWACGAAIGAPLGGYLVDTIGWRWAFYIQVPALILAFITVIFVLDIPVPDDRQSWTSKLKRVDFGGAFAMLISIFSLLYALDRGGNVAWHDTWTLSSLAAFVAFFALFTVVETRWAKEPFAPARILAGKHLFPSYLCNFFGIASALSLLFYVSLYLQVVSRKTAHEVGLYIIPSVFFSLAGSLGGGLIIQATGDFYWITVVGECTLLFGNLVLLAMIGVTRSVVGLMIGFLLGYFGNSIGITTTLISLIANAGPEDQAMATAISYLYRSLGSVVGLSVGSTLIQQTLRSSLHKTLKGRDDIEIIVTRVRESLTYVDELDPTTRVAVLDSYERAIYIAFCFTAVLGACAAISSFFVKAKSLQKPSAPGNGP
jgi:MFS family permease